MKTFTQKRSASEMTSLHQHTKAPPADNEQQPKVPYALDAKRRKKGKDLIPENYPEVPKLDKFDVKKNTLPDHFLMLLEGARRGGKSEFLRFLLYFYKDKFAEVIVMTKTPHNGFWQPIVGNQWVHDGWDPFLMQKIMQDQAELARQEYERDPTASQKEIVSRIKHPLVILDDIIGDRSKTAGGVSIHNDEILDAVATRGRHFGISCVITTQDPVGVGTPLRNNADVVVIFQQKTKRAKKYMTEDFLAFKLDFSWQTNDLLKTYTMNHDAIFMFMANLEKGTKNTYFHVPQSYTWDKKKDKSLVPDYQMGCEEQQRLARTNAGRIPLFPA